MLHGIEPLLAPESKAALTEAQALLRPRGSNQVGMRQFNERVVLQAIRLNGSLPKAELARLTGLTAQTIGLITARLEADRLILKQSAVRGRIGQPSIPLALNPDGAFSMGIKIGRRGTEWLLVDFTGQVRQRQRMDYLFPSTDALLPAIARNLQQMHDELGPWKHRLIGIGLAAPLQMGGWHHLLSLSQAQAEAWRHIDLRAQVQAMTEVPVTFAKDTSAACAAELVAGHGRDLKNFLYLFVDTFVGGGLVINSQLHGGVHGNAGALASLPMGLAQTQQMPEQLVSHASLWQLEQRFSASGRDPLAAYDDRALQADHAPDTHDWVARAANALAHTIVSGSAFLDIDAVVIDGSCSRALLAQLIAVTQDALQRYSWEGLWRAPVIAGEVGPDARVLGGALLPLHAHFAPNRDLFLKSGG